MSFVRGPGARNPGRCGSGACGSGTRNPGTGGCHACAWGACAWGVCVCGARARVSGARGTGLAWAAIRLPGVLARRRRLSPTASPAVAKTIRVPPARTAMPSLTLGGERRAAAVPLAGGGDTDGVAGVVAPGSGPKWTPGPVASAGSWRIQPGSIVLASSSRPPFGWSRPLFRLKICVNRLPAPSVLAAMSKSVSAGPLAAGGTMKYFTDAGDGEAEVPAGALESLADAAGPAHKAANIAVTTSAAAKTSAAVRSKAPASPRKALLRVIISVFSCQVGKNSAGVLGRARNGMPGRALTAQS